MLADGFCRTVPSHCFMIPQVTDQFFPPTHFLLVHQESDGGNTDGGTRLLSRPLTRFGPVILGGGRSLTSGTVIIKGREHQVIARLLRQVKWKSTPRSSRHIRYGIRLKCQSLHPQSGRSNALIPFALVIRKISYPILAPRVY